MKTFPKSSDSSIRANLRAWFDMANSQDRAQGRAWYNEAHDFAHLIADQTGVEPLTAAGVISALSPSNKWERNKIDALHLCQAWSTGRDPESVRCCTYGANKAKAWRILGGEQDAFSGSPKTFAFAQTVGNRADNCVVIDRWHARACLTRSKRRKVVQESLTPAQYNRVEALTVDEARKVDVLPYVYQATVWVTIKRFWEGGKNV